MRQLWLISAGLAISTGLALAQNVLVNPGFELDPPGPTNVFTGWTPYGSADSQSDIDAHSGTNSLKVFQAYTGAVNYNGVYQDYVSGAGASYTADGWAYTSAGETIAGQNAAWVEVSFRDALENIVALYRSATVTTNSLASGAFPTNTWVDLPVTNQFNPATFQFENTVTNLVAPAGTSFVRYQIVFQGDTNLSGGSLYVDDLSLDQTSSSPYGNWSLVWSDEFDGTAVDTNKWNFDIGNGANGWGNGELEYYTSQPDNVYVTNGVLHIVAQEESTNGFSYTSARLNTYEKFAMLYGRLEFRAQTPVGEGFWTALWTFPRDSVYGAWAASGELDDMENKGDDPDVIYGYISYGAPAPDQVHSTGPTYSFPSGDAASGFHSYLVEWTTNAITWYVDGQRYELETNWYSTGYPYPAPFNEPVYLIMDLAVGGGFVGPPDPETVFPAELLVDYVRVYAPPASAPILLTLSGISLNGGTVTLTGSGPPNTSYQVLASTNLSAPAIQWTSLATNQTTASGALTNSFTAASPAIFYRLEMP